MRVIRHTCTASTLSVLLVVLAVTLGGCAFLRGSGRQPARPAGIPDEQAAPLGKLRAASRTPVVVHFTDGRLRFAQFDIEAPVTGGDSPAQRAMAFLESHADLFGLRAPRETLFVSRLVRNPGGDHVFFDQHFGAVAVFGAQVAVHLDGSRIVAVNGDYVPGTPPPPEPALSMETAVSAAVQHAGAGARLAGSPRLNYFDWRLVYQPPRESKGPRRGAETRLVWRLTILDRGSNGGWDYFVDAANGAVITRLPTDRHQTAQKDYSIRTLNNTGELVFCGFVSATDWFTEAGPVQSAMPPPDAEGTAAFASTHVVYDFYNNNFGFRSWNGNDAQVRLNLDDFDQALNAAYMPSCNHFVFGNNMASRDVLAHEFTHGVIRSTASFLSSYEPGTLDESYSDIFSALIETSNWTLGEGTSLAAALNQGGVIRSLINPPVRTTRLTVDCGPLPPFTGCILPPGAPGPFTFAHPDRMSTLIRNATNDFSGDFGAIHANTGVTNKAAFLIASGGTHNGVTTVGIGRAKTAQLYFEVLTGFLTYNATIQSSADATILVAQAMARSGRNGFTAQDACTVNNAFAAVELALVDNDCDGAADATDVDDDNDAIPDAGDNCPLVANPSQLNSDTDPAGDACDADADGDMVANAVDNCPTTSNANQANTDQQQDAGDACDDSDADGFVDARDNCLWSPNRDQQNTDGDRWGDKCDRDFDGDGVCQVAGTTLTGETGVPPGGCPISDNCPLAMNQDQADTDGDGAGNACDRCPTAADTGIDSDGDGVDNACDPDDDGDGVADASDNCPSVKNADQRDINRNGIGTACDPQEQIVVNLGQSFFDLPIRQRLERNQVIELNLVPNLEDPGLCGLPGSGLAIQISITAGLPFVAGVVDDTGRSAGHVEGEREGAMEFVPAADFCAPRVPRSGESASLKSAFRGRSYALQILPRDSPPDGTQLRVKVEVIERAAGRLPAKSLLR